MSASLVGSEMCIRDRNTAAWRTGSVPVKPDTSKEEPRGEVGSPASPGRPCLLYTSDAADDM
eukprot:5624071-Alexandrium_andersonii.AAC.1